MFEVISAVLWLHVVAAIIWIGGMIFLSAVLVPVLRQYPGGMQRNGPFRMVALRFRRVVWTAILLLFATGWMLLQGRNLSLLNPNQWPAPFTSKLLFVVLLLAVTGLHDFVLGPYLLRSREGSKGVEGPLTTALLHAARWVPRLALALSLVVLYLAIRLARS